MKNLRIVPVAKSHDTYGTGDHQHFNVFSVRRDFEESDIWDSKRERGNDPSAYFSKEVIEKGREIVQLPTEEMAQFVIDGFKKKYKIKN